MTYMFILKCALKLVLKNILSHIFFQPKNGLFGYLVEEGQIKNGVNSEGKRFIYVC